jgi:hypothetical protein
MSVAVTVTVLAVVAMAVDHLVAGDRLAFLVGTVLSLAAAG